MQTRFSILLSSRWNLGKWSSVFYLFSCLFNKITWLFTFAIYQCSCAVIQTNIYDIKNFLNNTTYISIVALILIDQNYRFFYSCPVSIIPNSVSHQLLLDTHILFHQLFHVTLNRIIHIHLKDMVHFIYVKSMIEWHCW